MLVLHLERKIARLQSNLWILEKPEKYTKLILEKPIKLVKIILEKPGKVCFDMFYRKIEKRLYEYYIYIIDK